MLAFWDPTVNVERSEFRQLQNRLVISAVVVADTVNTEIFQAESIQEGLVKLPSKVWSVQF